jgi:hypothetical protein
MKRRAVRSIGAVVVLFGLLGLLVVYITLVLATHTPSP